MRTFNSLIALTILIFSFPLLAQNFTWEWQNPLPTGADHNGTLIYSNKYFLFGNGGAFSVSTDEGTTWNVSYIDPLSRNLNAGVFINDNVGIVVGSSGVILKTTDGGATWAEKTSGTTQILYSVDFFGSNGLAVGAAGVVLISSDFGETWTSTTYGTTANFDVFFINDTTAFMAASSATTGRLVKTTDAGATWINMNSAIPGLTSGTVRSIYFPLSSIGYLSTSVGTIFKTTDGGNSWTQSYSIGSTTTIIYSVHFANELFGAASTTLGRIIVTTDGGANWTLSQTPVTKSLFSVSAYTSPKRNAFLVGNILSGGDAGSIILSNNFGNTWTKGFIASSQEQLQRVHFPSMNVGYAVGGSITSGNSFGDVLKTTDGGASWVKLPLQTATRIYSVFFLDELTGYVGSEGPTGLYKTTDGGQNWTQLNTGTGVSTSILYDIDFYNNDTGFVCYSSGNVARTTNGGSSWTSISAGFGAAAVYDMHIVSWNSMFILGPGGRVSKSTDGGVNFLQLPSLGTTTLYSVYFIHPDTGYIVGSGKIFKTTNAYNFVEVTSPVTSTIYTLRFLNNQIGWFGASNGDLYYTTDGGNSWTKSNIRLGSSQSIRDIQLKGERLWLVGTDGMIIRGFSDPFIPVELESFSASLNGKNVELIWTTATESNNMGFMIERKSKSNDESDRWEELKFIKGNGTTTSKSNYSYTDYIGEINNNISSFVYRLKQIDYDGTINYSNEIEVSINVPEEFTLYQNYPNPFNPETTIKFNIPNQHSVSLQVSLKIYDMLGKEVTTLINEEKSPGIHEIKWDASAFASGIYFYTLRAREFTSTRKLILIK